MLGIAGKTRINLTRFMKNRFQSLGKVILVILSFFLGHSLHAQTQIGQDIDGEASGDRSGCSVSMPDANTVAIGARNNDGNGTDAGHVRIYSRNGSSWIQKGVDIDGEAAYNASGYSVSMSDANNVAIGAPYSNGHAGQVRIFSWNGNSWLQKGADIDGEASGDWSGYRISMPDSNTVAIGAIFNSTNGHVRIYSWNGNSWMQKGTDIDDSTGYSYVVSMPDANTIAIGNPYGGNGHVRVFSWNGNGWIQKGADIDGEASQDFFGTSVSMPNVNTVAIGAPQNDGNGTASGHVRIFSWNGSNWIQKGQDIDGESAYDFFGESVSMPNANIIAIGGNQNDGNGSNSGHVRIFSYDGSNWVQKGPDIDGEASLDLFGSSVSMPDVNTLAIGAFNNDGNGSDAGHVRVINANYTPIGGIVNNRGCIECVNFSAGEYFRINGDTMLVVDRTMLDSMIAGSHDITKVCVSHILNMSYAFQNQTAFNQDIGNWDVSSVTSMSNMFHGANLFNQDISNWDVSSVTSMSGMFMSSTGFNQDISNWDVSNVTDMSNMFFGAINFNTPLYPWDVSSVTSMNSMFAFTPSFNKGLGSWDVSSVTDMDNMFSFSTSFNQDLSQWCVSQFSYLPINFSINSPLVNAYIPNWGSCKEPTIDSMGCIECENYSIGEWFVSDGDSLLVVNRPMLDSLVDISFDLKHVCTSYITDLDSLFKGSQVNGDITKWDVSNVTSMYETFYGCTDFNQEIETWNVSKVENMSGLFRGASSFNSDISPWDVSALKNASRLFKLASSFNQDLMEWNVSGVTNMNSMFFGASAFNDSINSWDVSKVTDANSMFLFASSFNQPLNTWDTYAMDDMSNMFYFANSFNQDLSGWCVGKHPSMPSNFASYATLDSAHFPIWGSCEIAPGVNLDGNGCLQCDSLNVGDFFTYNGDSIEVVNRFRLLQIISNQGDLTKVCVSHVDFMKKLFQGAKWFNQDISNWDVSNVTNMNSMFFNAEIFNQDISTWNTGNVRNMSLMFFRADSFNQDLNQWDVSQVENMSRTFKEAGSFNGNISSWNVENVTNMTEMFEDAFSFNQNISSWCVRNFLYGEPKDFAVNSLLIPSNFPNWGNCAKAFDNVNTLAIGGFINSHGCVDCSGLNIGDYFALNGDTLVVADRAMLDSLITIATDLSKVCVSHITDMKDALRGLTWFNTDISTWDVSNVTDMSNMFFKAKNFNQDIGNWDVSSVTKMSRMFQVAQNFNQDIGSWDVSNVTRMPAMFRNADAFNAYIGDWDVSNVFNMSDMFRSADSYHKYMNYWCVPLITSLPSGFATNSGLVTSQIPNWGNCNQRPARVLENNCIYCEDLNVGDQFVLEGDTITVVNEAMLGFAINNPSIVDYSKYCVSKITSMNNLFAYKAVQYDITRWDVSNVTDMESMFEYSNSPYASTNFNQPIGNWDVSNVTNMVFMFQGCSAFNQPLVDWNVSNVTNMARMFTNCSSFNKPINSWNVSNVDNMSFMFAHASNFNQNISGWDVSNVTNMGDMFKGAAAFNQNIGNWNFQASIMSEMFSNASNFDQPIGSWDVSNVTDMKEVFYQATSFNQNISDWDVANVTNMRYLFGDAINFNQDISSWNVALVTNADGLLHNATSFDQDLSTMCFSSLSSAPNGWSQGSVLGYNYAKWPQFGSSCIPFRIDNSLSKQSIHIDHVEEENIFYGKEPLSFYPNPTTGVIYLETVSEGTYQLFNEIGRLIDQGKIEPSYDFSSLENGLYILLLQTEEESKYFKVIKQ